MRFKFNLCWLAAPAALLLTGCIDDNYDLSNIDTTSQFKINDLVLPLNLDPVVLDDIIEVKEGDKLNKVNINGKVFYAVEQTGDFNSDGVEVDGFTAEPDPLYDKVAVFKPQRTTDDLTRAGEVSDIYLLVDPVTEDVEYEAADIDGSIRTLRDIYFNDNLLKIEISTTELGDGIESALENVELEIFKGLEIKSITAGGISYEPSLYNKEFGTLPLENVPFTDNKTAIEIVATAINLDGFELSPFAYDPTTDSGKFDLTSQLNINNSQLKLTATPDELASLETVSYAVHYYVDPLVATSIKGKIAYNLEGTGLNIEPINLEDLPSFLSDPQTNLILSNPQVYLQLQNPVGAYGLGYQSSLLIQAIRDHSIDAQFPSTLIEVPGHTGTFNYLLAPYEKDVKDIPSDFAEDIVKLQYKDLGYLLSGNGLPSALDVKIVDPIIPEKEVTSPFLLNTDIEGMEGKYMFLAPLSLKEGSQIVKSIDGWWSENLEDLTIDVLKVSADASSTIPMDVIITGYAIDKDGNKIETASDFSVELPAGASAEPIVFLIEGTITDLDGIKLTVLAGSDDDTPLAPDQVITLNNLKAQVSGTYTRKL